MQLGRVRRVNKSNYVVDGKSLILSGRLLYTLDKPDYPVVGDYVIYTKDNVIYKICSRETELYRASVNRTSNRIVLGSNMDIVFICMSLNNDFNLTKLNGFLNIAIASKAKPVVILTKNDLVDDDSKYIDDVKSINSDVEIISVSVVDNSVKKLIDIIEDKTIILLGASGVGKSSIINKLCGREVFKTNTIRESDSQGRHTTSFREMIHLEEYNTWIIDIPGIRIFQEHSFNKGQFADIHSLANECKFSNCTHKHEPGCRVIAAIESGELSENHFNNYLKALRVEEYYKKRMRK